MKRPLTISTSFKALEDEEQDAKLIPIITPAEAEDQKLQPFILSGMDEDDEDLPSLRGHSALGEKKRRLSVVQVKALEQNFEVENKLDPERKLRLARDLGLQPRQVAVWFQNRRARWKSKQLERDYGALKSRYDSLKLDCDSLVRDKEALLSEIKELKSKLENTKPVVSLSTGEEEKPALMYRDGSSDSDSSAVFNDEAGAMLEQQCELVEFRADCSTFLLEEEEDGGKYLDEELLSGEEMCSGLFSEEQPAGMSWYCSMQGWD